MSDKPSQMIVVFGLDADGKARGAKFAMCEEELARRAAMALGYEVVVAASPADLNLAANLPPGRIHRPGALFASRVKPRIYDGLRKLLPLHRPAEGSADMNPGDTGSAPAAKRSGRPRPAHDLWKSLHVGSGVLASQPGMDGWWEAKVVGVSPKGKMLILRWDDSDDGRTFMAPRMRVALKRPSRRKA